MHVCIKYGSYSQTFYLFGRETRNLWGRGLIMKINSSELHISMSSYIYSAGWFCILVTSSPFSLFHTFTLSLFLSPLFLSPDPCKRRINFVLCRTSRCGRTYCASVIKYCNSGNLISHVLIETLHKPLRLVCLLLTCTLHCNHFF